MTDDRSKDIQPSFALYQEWIGYDSYVKTSTIENMRVSIEAQGGDLDDVVATVMYFRSKFHGYLYLASAPLLSDVNLKRRRMI